jgi:hypothetical protein
MPCKCHLSNQAASPSGQPQGVKWGRPEFKSQVQILTLPETCPVIFGQIALNSPVSSLLIYKAWIFVPLNFLWKGLNDHERVLTMYYTKQAFNPGGDSQCCDPTHMLRTSVTCFMPCLLLLNSAASKHCVYHYVIFSAIGNVGFKVASFVEIDL